MRAQSSTRRARSTIFLAMALALTLLLALSGSVLAAPPTKIHEATTFAGAFSEECVVESDGTEVCSFVDIQAFSRGTNWEVCVNRSSSVFPPAGDPTFTNAYGCTIVGANRFTIDRKLTSATIRPTVIPLASFTCDAFGNCTETTEDVTVSASWMGTGEVIRFRDRSTFQQGKCKQTF